MTRRENLGDRVDAFRDKMRMTDRGKAMDWSEAEFDVYKDEKLDRLGLVVYYDIEGVVRDEYLLIPKGSGFAKSNLKEVLDKNPGLPDNTADWPGCDILIGLDKGGYYELAK